MPRYDDKMAKLIERQTAEFVRGVTGFVVQLLPKDDVADFTVHHGGTGRVLALCEVKHRDKQLADHATIHISQSKVIRLLNDAMRRDVDTKTVLIVVCRENHYFFCIPKILQGYEVTFSGRQDRGNPRDMERMINFPTELFKPLDQIGELFS